MAKVLKQWLGAPPDMCDMCRRGICDVFIDGKTSRGPWANMCVACHMTHGVGLGTGRGQQYELRKSGDWVKVQG